jgi:RNA polymerase sigma-70 factor, ECF subfamily
LQYATDKVVSSDPGDITKILIDLRNGKSGAQEELIPLVYTELRKQAARYLRRERSDHTLQATALVHEAYLRLVGQREKDWENRAHFFAVAAHLMRLILVDHARKRRAVKHGGGGQKVPIESVLLFSEEQFDELIALDEALSRLGEIDPRMVKVVELRYFSDLSVDETAAVLGVSPKTVKRDWQLARPWLHAELRSYRANPV